MITASIVTYKTNRVELATVLRCVVESEVERVYIVDNSPGDELRDFAEFSPKVEYIFGHGNVGYGAAHNIAIRRSIDSGAKYHVVINPDIQFSDGVIEELVSYMDNNADVGHVMPRVVYPDGELQYLCKMLPTPMDLIFKRFLPLSLTQKSMYKFQLKFTGYQYEMNVPYLSGCFMFFRCAALSEVGLFDERFFMYPEDIDITRRMHARFRTMFYPKVTIIHAHAAAHRVNKKMLWISIKNMVKYFNKWGWIFDAQRRKVNKELLESLNYKSKE